MPHTDYDLIIIGGGPAGLTAGLYAARARLNALLVERLMPGGQVFITDRIENYPGFPRGITGPELSRLMQEQVERLELEIAYDEVLSTDLSGPVKTLQMSEKSLTAKAVIITTGAAPRRLGVPGEDQFFGKGISSCATCDGPFYRDGVVAAVGGGDTAVKESIFLTRFVRKVCLIHRRDELRAEKILQEQALANEKIEIIWDTVVTGVSGLERLEAVHTRNVKTGENRTLTADAFFVWIGILPNVDCLGTAVERDPFGFIRVDARMQTSVPGVFAAGDVRETPLRQIATAVGDAAIAVFSAEQYIEKLEL